MTLLQTLPVGVPAKVWNILFGWIPATSGSCSSGSCAIPITGAIVYAVLLAGVVIIGFVLWSRRTTDVTGPDDLSDLTRDPDPDDDDEDSDGEADDDAEVEEPDDPFDDADAEFDPDSGVRILEDTEELHKTTIVPPPIQRKTDHVIVGNNVRKTLHGYNTPDVIADGAFDPVLKRPDLQFDMAMHFNPVSKKRAAKDAERRAESLQTDAILNSEGGDQFGASDDMSEAERLGSFREQINAGERPFRVTTYFSIIGDTLDEVEEQEQQLRHSLEDKPANLNLRTCYGQQVRAMESVAPLSYDKYRDSSAYDPYKIWLGQGVGAALSSANQSVLIEDSGIEMGYHTFNGSPIIKDPFESETNYNWVVIGDSGSGKSYSNKLWALRSKLAQQDTRVVILDPMSGFDGLAEALNAERIEIGGSRGLNPLEIKPPSGRVAAEQTEGDDPLSTKIKEVMEFFESFAQTQGQSLGKLRPFLNDAVVESYSRKGISHSIETHHNDSPTVNTVIEVLKDMQQSPEDFLIGETGNTDKIKRAAEDLLNLLRPFRKGQYENLTEETDFNFDNDVIYLDLKNIEGSQNSGGGLMMKLVFSLVYERAKETPKNVIFLIDEAHYLMSDAESLEFLKTRNRHARHYDTSLRYLTQEVADFFGEDHEEQPILNNTFIKVFLRLDEIRDHADQFNLNPQMIDFIDNANTGKNHDYSQALALVNGEPYPMNILSDPAEHAVVDFDKAEDEIADLPGRDSAAESDLVRNIRRRLLKRKYNDFEQNIDLSTADIMHDEFEDSDELALLMEMMSTEEMIEILEEIDQGTDIQEAVYHHSQQKITAIADSLPDEAVRRLRDGLDKSLGTPDPDNAPANAYNDD
ncbi:hypothetical protein SAMN05216388_100914 [Halorientalis persicus]|uniref:TraG P-loop domain-containing protein n=1 Tax=Halorientalis persicus TaxID=1367881 RepID=A0A1H8MJE3_9EURY|nr:hypothetical protein [Halorientalis persicus]SEO17266.1 hypothetical protein SAMN05216388_100914 [Halorientalis persicus]